MIARLRADRATVQLYGRQWLITPISCPTRVRWWADHIAAQNNCRWLMAKLTDLGYVRGEDFELVTLADAGGEIGGNFAKLTLANTDKVFRKRQPIVYRDVADTEYIQTSFLCIQNTPELIRFANRWAEKAQKGICSPTWYAEALEVKLMEIWEDLNGVIRYWIWKQCQFEDRGISYPENLIRSLFQKYFMENLGTGEAAYFDCISFFEWIEDRYHSGLGVLTSTSPLWDADEIWEYEATRMEHENMRAIIGLIKEAKAA